MDLGLLDLIEQHGLPWGIAFVEAIVIWRMWVYTRDNTVPLRIYERQDEMVLGTLQAIEKALLKVATVLKTGGNGG